ncbi:MAG: RNB domain-containing ribonuclease [Burkholderiaceae bacterium]|nr:RNB domain-containing ribonuclease [Burkholderiaceae bacterium]
MFGLYEEGGKVFAGRVMSETASSAQIELDSGKRVKVKATNVLLKFDSPPAAGLIASAQQLATDVDIDLAWEFAPAEDFAFSDLAREYYSAKATPEQQAAMLLALFNAPHYFRRLGRGQFKKAPIETVKAALLGIERKQQQAAQVSAWATELASGVCPAPVREQMYKILFRPDKNAPEYKAVVEAAKRAHKGPLDLLTAAGAIDNPYQFHWRRFLFEHFPKGTDFPALPVPTITEPLPLACAQAFSIDNSATTEIDDALSVQGQGTGAVVFGIHIAAPGLAFAPDCALDAVARDRLSTVYMPGHKLTMLPDAVVQAYTLIEGRECPVVSLYFTLDEASLDVIATETRLERVSVAANLRHDQLDNVVTEDSLLGVSPANYRFAAELAFAFRLARHLKAQRESVRGKPETFNRPDFTFRLNGGNGKEPSGDEAVQISIRKRGAALDLIVAEAMILANSTWGAWLNTCGVPGIYRSQASLAPGIKVRMSTKAQPHAGMGVAQYAWSTSPLRRYVDLVNQWQIIACARHGRTAALAAPFKPNDALLFSIISSFDAAYTDYASFQSGIERYWALRYLMQNEIQELDASVVKDGLVRADALPLVFRAGGADNLPRGARVRVRVRSTDLLTLDVDAILVARLDEPVAPEQSDDVEGADDIEAAGPLTLVLDTKNDATEGAAFDPQQSTV